MGHPMRGVMAMGLGMLLGSGMPVLAEEAAEASPREYSKDRMRAESLLSKLRGVEKPEQSPLWKEFLANPETLALVRERLKSPTEPDRALAVEIKALAALEGVKASDECARLAIEYKSARVRAAAREALKTLNVPTPKRVLQAMRAPVRELGLRALDVVKEMPDEQGLYGIVVAADLIGYGGGGPRSYVFFGVQYAYIQDITAVVQVNAVGYDPEIGYVTTATVLDTKVLTVEEMRRVFYEVSGVQFPSTGKAQEWWEQNKGEVLRRIEEKQRKGTRAP